MDIYKFCFFFFNGPRLWLKLDEIMSLQTNRQDQDVLCLSLWTHMTPNQIFVLPPWYFSLCRCQLFASHLPSCPAVSVSYQQNLQVTLLIVGSSAARQVQPGSVVAAGVLLQSEQNCVCLAPLCTKPNRGLLTGNTTGRNCLLNFFWGRSWSKKCEKKIKQLNSHKNRGQTDDFNIYLKSV